MGVAAPGATVSAANGSVAGRDPLPTTLNGLQSPVYWGMLALVAIETVVFATLLSSYFYLRLLSDEWPPAGVPNPKLLLPVINTVVLLTSSGVLLWATRALSRGDQRRLKIGLGIAIVLEGVFFTIKMVVSTGLPFSWSDHAYGSIFASIDRLHSLHVVVAIVMAIVVEILAFRGEFDAEHRLGIQAVNIYWQFVALIWLPVFFVLFLVPRWM